MQLYAIPVTTYGHRACNLWTREPSEVQNPRFIEMPRTWHMARHEQAIRLDSHQTRVTSLTTVTSPPKWVVTTGVAASDDD